MSRQSTLSASEQFADAIIPLLKEFGDKVKSLGEAADGLHTKFASNHLFWVGSGNKLLDQRLHLLREDWKHLKPPIVKLAQHASQQLEHGGLDDVTQLELMLRLAEFESAIRSTEEILAS